MTRPAALELRDAIARGDRSAADVCRDAVERVRLSPSKLNAFLTVADERAAQTCEGARRTA